MFGIHFYCRCFLLFAVVVEAAARGMSPHRSAFFCKPHAIATRIPRCGGGESNHQPVGDSNNTTHEILHEKVHFSRWRTVSSRLVRFPDGRVVDFDVVGQAGSRHAVLIFAWDSKTKTATIIKEYMPGAHAVKAGLAAGLVEEKHNGVQEEESADDVMLTAAKFELEEECHLVGGTWLRLTDDTIMDKYATTVVSVYLVLDPQKAVNPRPLDAEEDIVICPNVKVSEILEMIAKGEMNVVGGWASLIAIEKLRELGEI